MELEDLDNINKNDFLPLLPLNIKQELLDNGGVAGSGDGRSSAGGDDGGEGGGGGGAGAAGAGGSTGLHHDGVGAAMAESVGAQSRSGESAHLCDSVQKQVIEMCFFLSKLFYEAISISHTHKYLVAVYFDLENIHWI